MKDLTAYLVCKKLIGNILPIGCSSRDEELFDNLTEHNVLVGCLIEDLMEASKYKDSHEYSVSRSGKYAENALIEIKELIDSVINNE